MVNNSPAFSSFFCAQCCQPIQMNHKNSPTCCFPTQQKCIYVHMYIHVYTCMYVHRNTEGRVLQLSGNVLLLCSLSSSLCRGRLGDPSGTHPMGCRALCPTAAPSMLPVLCWLFQNVFFTCEMRQMALCFPCTECPVLCFVFPVFP